MTSSTVCLIAKNEERGIEEWMAYQKVVGFDRVVIYDNESTDSTASIIKRIAAKDTSFEYILWADSPGRRPQVDAYADALDRCTTEWIGFFDADEFYVPLNDEYVNSFLARFDIECSAVAINWLVFGSSGQEKASDELTISRFKRCAPKQHGKNRFCKSFVRAGRVSKMIVHHAELINGYYCNSAGVKLSGIEAGAKTPTIDFTNAQLNHYIVKSLEEFQIKKARGHSNRAAEERDKFTNVNQEYWRNHDINDDSDSSILKFLPKVVETIQEWSYSG